MDIVSVKNNIEKMNKFNQIEVLRILNKHGDVIINESRYGIHVNLTDLKNAVIDELNQYIQYVQAKEGHKSRRKTKRRYKEYIFFLTAKTNTFNGYGKHQSPKFNIHLLDKYMLNESLMNTISRNGYVDTSFLKKQKTVIENLSSISEYILDKDFRKTQIEKTKR